MVWHTLHPQKKLYQYTLKGWCWTAEQTWEGEGGLWKDSRKTAAPWQAETTPMGCQPCPWAPCGLLKEPILSQEAPALLFFPLSDIWSLSTVPRTRGAALGAWPGNCFGSEVTLLYPGAGTPKPAHLLKKVWNDCNLDLRVCVFC